MRAYKVLFFTLLFSLSTAISGFSAATWQETDSIKATPADTIAAEIYADDPILAALDDLWSQQMLDWQAFEMDTTCLNVYKFEPGFVPEYNDSILLGRLELLNSQTTIDLTYNSYVKAFINLYVNQRRDVTSRVLGLASLYYPMFEEKLDQFNIPLELKHLAVVESALNPKAKSRVGATGLWQFMYATGKMYGLEVDTYVDERSDPYQATIAACRYMSALYRMYGDWNLVLAAYNSGPGNVNKAIRRSGGKRDYWEIRPYLPRETRGYVPAFIAVNYAMNYATEHNLYPVKPAFLYAEIDTVHVCKEMRLEHVSLVTALSIDALQLLNPSLKQYTIPARPECKAIYLPVASIGVFLANEDSLENYTLPEPLEEEPAHAAQSYTVRSGDVLGLIAERHGVGVSQIKEWNNLRSHNIHVGQKLVIYSDKPAKAAQVASAQNDEKPKASMSAADMRMHTVQSGDTLWDIAKKYPGISMDDLKKANASLNFSRLKPGQKIKIPHTT